MKMYTPDGSEMINVKSIEYENKRIILEVVVMTSMPAKVHLTGEEFRKVFKLISLRLIFGVIKMVFSK
jgi:hypothetical protein